MSDHTVVDPRNEHLIAYVGGELLPRAEAKVSVFDSVVQGGDAVWEGLRVYDGRVFQLDAHLDRLLDSAKAMAFADVPTRDEVRNALFATLKANGMRDVTTPWVHKKLIKRIYDKIDKGREDIVRVELNRDTADKARIGVISYGATARPSMSLG